MLDYLAKFACSAVETVARRAKRISKDCLDALADSGHIGEVSLPNRNFSRHD